MRPRADSRADFQALSGVIFLCTAVVASSGCAGEDALTATWSRVDVSDSLELGEHYVGDLIQGELTIASAGTGAAILRDVHATDPSLTVEWQHRGSTGVLLNSGAPLAITLAWHPVRSGSLDARVEVTTDEDVHLVSVTGAAVEIPTCDDANPCTGDGFDRPTEQCTHVPHTGPCDDGSACTEQDRCEDGACRGVAITCDDANGCTLDLCDPTVGCVYPTDPSACDDGDPCTSDECDPGGCSFPNAPEGTACGPLTCAEANICVSGTCHTIDISGSSDDVPCDDGNHCTDGDMCHGGVCIGGPTVAGPAEVVATFETFGGEGSTVGTDGTTYVFADPDALRIARLARDAPILEHAGTLDLISHLPPVPLGGGQFAVATATGVAVIDATNASMPAIASTLDIFPAPVLHLARTQNGLLVGLSELAGDSGFAPAPSLLYYPVDPLTHALGDPHDLAWDATLVDLATQGADAAWLQDGIVTWVHLADDGTVTESAQWAPSVMVPLPLGTSIAASGAPPRVSVDSRRVAVLANGALALYDIETSVGINPCEPPDPAIGPSVTIPAPCVFVDANTCPGDVPAAGYLPCTPGVAGACNGDPLLECRDASMPAMLGMACDGDTCCVPIAVCVPKTEHHAALLGVTLDVLGADQDIVLDGQFLYAAGSAGVTAYELAYFMCMRDSGCDFSISRAAPALDSTPGTRLEPAAGQLLVSGTIARPLVAGVFTGGADVPFNGAGDGERAGSNLVAPEYDLPPFFRLTGPRHGTLRGIVDGGTGTVILAGRASIAELDLEALELENWRSTDGVSSAAEPRILRGETRAAIIDDVTERPMTACDKGYPPSAPGCSCASVPLSLLDGTGVESVAAACDAGPGSVDVSGAQVWVHGSADLVDDTLSMGLRAWHTGEVDPFYFAVDTLDGSVDSATTRVRAGSDGSRILTAGSVFPPDVDMQGGMYFPPLLHLRIFATDAGGNPLLNEVEVPIGLPASGRVGRHRVAVDGSQTILVGGSASVSLYDPPLSDIAESAPDPSSTVLTFPFARGDVPVAVMWMDAGRAWVAWEAPDYSVSTGPDEPRAGSRTRIDVSPGHRLAQVVYGAGDYVAPTLENEGDVVLPGAPISVYDDGDHTVVTTNNAVVVIAPGCTP